jgi:hypothetical protein
MDVLLRSFLQRMRPRARRAHLATYEDVALAMEGFLRARHRSAARLRVGELHLFLGYWYLRRHHPTTSRRARRFCAATSVLVHWLTAGASERRRRLLRREARRAGRDATRAARAMELLELLPASARLADPTEIIEDYCEVVVRARAHLVLRPLSAPALVGPVVVPEALAAALDPGAILNLQLGRSDGRWAILDHGFCYPSGARQALRATEVTG